MIWLALGIAVVAAVVGLVLVLGRMNEPSGPVL